MAFVQLQLRRGTAAQWTAADPTLAAGEIGLETDTSQFKIGDGSTAWSSLSYGGLVGPQGPTGATGPQGATGPAGAAGADGDDGREIELQQGATHIQWRYVSDAEWTDLIAIADITGPQGATGATGAAGATGATGAQGPAGEGVPVGGTTGQVLQKASSTNFDTSWTALKTVGGNSLLGSGDITVGATPGGSDTHVQYNASGSLAGEAAFTYNASTNTLSVDNIAVQTLALSGNVSASAWTTSGIGIRLTTRTLTDTSSSGTVAAAYTNVLGGNTIAASSATTFTEYASLYLGNASAGSNVTITNGYSLITAGAAKFGGNVTAPNLANGRSMRVFTPLDNQPPASNFATLDTRNSIAVLDFDAATDESAVFVGVVPEGATLTSGIVVRIFWMATSATSGDCVWGAQFEKYGTDYDSDSFDTAVTATTTASGTSGIAVLTSITITTIDSLAAGDAFRLKVYRDADSGSDTMTGDAELVVVEVRAA